MSEIKLTKSPLQTLWWTLRLAVPAPRAKAADTTRHRQPQDQPLVLHRARRTVRNDYLMRTLGGRLALLLLAGIAAFAAILLIAVGPALTEWAIAFGKAAWTDGVAWAEDVERHLAEMWQGVHIDVPDFG